MKKSILLAFLFVAFATAVVAQPEKPKKEFLLSLSETSIQLNPGESKDITIDIVRSNAFSKGKAKLGLSSTLPAGVTVNFEPAEGALEKTTIKLAVSAEAKPGTYTILPTCVINNKSKGTMLKLVVGGQSGQVISGE